jgi:hypothetical protein
VCLQKHKKILKGDSKMAGKSKNQTGLESICDGCLEKLTKQIGREEIPENLLLLAVQEKHYRQLRRQISTPLSERYRTADVSVLEAYARNIGDRYGKDVQEAAVNELVRRIVEMTGILSLPMETE